MDTTKLRNKDFVTIEQSNTDTHSLSNIQTQQRFHLNIKHKDWYPKQTVNTRNPSRHGPGGGIEISLLCPELVVIIPAGNVCKLSQIMHTKLLGKLAPPPPEVTACAEAEE